MSVVATTKTALTVGNAVFNSLKTAYQARQEERVESFFRCIELRYEVMQESERAELEKVLNSDDGKKILASYVDAITQTSSDRVRMAVALLYCQDTDFQFSEHEQVQFINGVAGITDHMIDFYLMAVSQEEIKGNLPYEKRIIREIELDKLPMENLDGEIVYSYVNELIRRGLLLPEPEDGSMEMYHSENWSISFGTSKRIIKMSRLISKADMLLGN